ncbi:hypothetical protein [Pseudomonas abietaniphila]|jgi:hypothetical protein|uniref:Uncharacterized protein n=1 Tax=Pseudomonas abietaniphila TaxID=89065 RepID=A0A1G8PRD4_9PSED|nr:hypothetical protein [Pseudomonas abietaniphila]SDI95084.1 hypothetical protein SAMN05216605_11987 [Pseudomonas abietaniphila]
MKFHISFLRIDTTIPDWYWPDADLTSRVNHEYVSTEDHKYQDCQTCCDIEARFESLNNYDAEGQRLKCPQMKLKVLRVEAMPSKRKRAA